MSGNRNRFVLFPYYLRKLGTNGGGGGGANSRGALVWHYGLRVVALFGEECLCQKIRYLKFIFSPKDNSCPHSFLYLRYDVKCHSAVMVFQWRDIVVSYGQLCSGIDLNKIKKFIRRAVGCCKRAKLYRAFKSFLYITIGLRRCHRQLLSRKRPYKFKKTPLNGWKLFKQKLNFL